MVEEPARPNPDELLLKIKADENQGRRGRLKVFLGYAAGVGKTYTMLEAGKQRSRDSDVVVAFVETHGRTETEALLQGLEVIPRREVDYRGIRLTEMDLDAVLARRPRVALVDELAHDNAPGSRHLKRYLDIMELLDAGIDVYTTLNIQHVESARNVVAQITGVWVRETVPDSIIDSAAEIELVDLPPEELVKRLHEGKVYIREQIADATEKFFRRGNLTALRELTMRTAAKHVDEQTIAYMKAHAVEGLWPSGERLLVCVVPGLTGARLLRGARRLAHQLGAPWFAVYVETPGTTRLHPDEQDRLAETLRLAEQLGAKTVTIQGAAVAPSVTEYARANNISRIVVPAPRRRRWYQPFNNTLANQFLRRSESFDIYIMGGSEASARSRMRRTRTPGAWRGYLAAFGLVVLATLLGQAIRTFFTPTTLVMVYLLAVVLAAVRWGLGPSILVSVLGVLAFDFFFVPPFLSFDIADTQYVFTFAVLLGVGVTISYLTTRIKAQTAAARRHEHQLASLYAMGRDLAVATSLESYVQAITSRASGTFGRKVIVLLPDKQKKDTLRPYPDGQAAAVTENDSAAALWAFQHKRMVGPGTDTLPNAGARFVPLLTARGAVGVMVLFTAEGTAELAREQERLLAAYADLAAVAIESILLGEEAHSAEVLRNTEKLQTALLNSISHDLRTPLVSIIGALSSLEETEMSPDENARKKLTEVAREEAVRLNRLITNLLDESRIEAGAIRVSKRAADVQDLIGSALEQLGDQTEGRSVTIDVPAELPSVAVDFGLIVQTFVNILDNALKYSPGGSPLEIRARGDGAEVAIEIVDRGVGIPAEDLVHVFDKFYRVKRPDNVGGTGLGLSIAKGIVEAHGGRIAAENRPGGGTVIRVTLPVAQPASSEKRHE